MKDASTGLPLEGAQVTGGGSGAFTGPDGRFVMRNVETYQNRPTYVTVTAAKLGYNPASKGVQIYCGASVVVDIGTAPPPVGTLAGVVTDAATGQPVSGATVGGAWGETTTTAADGTYAFANVPGGPVGTPLTWDITAIPPSVTGLETLTLPVDVVAGQNATRDLALTKPVNERPSVESRTITVAPTGDISLTIPLVGDDPDGDPLTFRIFGRDSHGIIRHETATEASVFLRDGDPGTSFWYVASDGYREGVAGKITIVRSEQPTENDPPVAVIAPLASAVEGTAVAFDGTGSTDADGTVVAWAWDLDGDGQYDDSTSSQPSRTYDDDAAVAVGLRVTDDDGATAITSASLVIQNAAPVVSAGADVTVGADGHLVRTGSFADPGADTWSATVDWGDGAGPQPLALSGTGFTLDHTYPGAGTRTVTVQVCDDDEGCGTDTVSVVVPDPANVPPTAAVDGPSTVVEGATATFDAGGSTDSDGDVVAWEWDLDGDGAFDDASGEQAAVATSDDGTVAVSVRVRDDDGGVSSPVSATVVVTNAIPVVAAGIDETITLGDPFVRGGSFTDPGADQWTASVDHGTGAGPQPLPLTPGREFDLGRTFTAAGTYDVVVEVCDDDGGCGTAAFRVTVSEAPPEPADLGISLAGPTDLVDGATARWTATVANGGPGISGAVEVAVTLPAELDDPELGGDGWTCEVLGDEATCRHDSLDPSDEAVLDIEGTATASGPTSSRILVAVEVSAQADDPDRSDNLDSIEASVAPTTTTTTSTTSTSTTTTSTHHDVDHGADQHHDDHGAEHHHDHHGFTEPDLDRGTDDDREQPHPVHHGSRRRGERRGDAPAPHRLERRSARPARAAAARRRDRHRRPESSGSPPPGRPIAAPRRDREAAAITAGRPDLVLAVTGRGEREPIAPNTDAEGREQNRRVEIRHQT